MQDSQQEAEQLEQEAAPAAEIKYLDIQYLRHHLDESEILSLATSSSDEGK
jgi:hypothetical protein